MTPGRHNLPPIRRGDTVQALELARVFDADGAPVPITSARLQLRNKDDSILYEWSTAADNLTLSGTPVTHIITLDALDETTTAAFTPDEYRYDLEITKPDGEVWTILTGNCVIDADITR